MMEGIRVSIDHVPYVTTDLLLALRSSTDVIRERSMNNNHNLIAQQPIPTPCCCCGHLSNSPREPVPQNERILKAIHVLQLGRLSLYSALLKVLDPADKAFAAHRDRIYACPKDRPDGKLAQLLDCLYEDRRGKAQLLAWMEPRALQSLARKVYDEMDDIKRVLNGTMDTITPEFLLKWDINSTVQKIMQEHAPVLSEILESAAQSSRASRENTVKDVSTVGIARTQL